MTASRWHERASSRASSSGCRPRSSGGSRTRSRRGESTLNDVAVGISGRPLRGRASSRAAGRGQAPGDSGMVLLRLPRGVEARAPDVRIRARVDTNRVISRRWPRARRSARGTRRTRVPFGGERRVETMAEENGTEERQGALAGHGAGRDHRRRQLRELVRPGRPVLPRGARRPVRPRADAREPGRLPHPRRRVHGRLRRRRGQGRRRPADAIWAQPNNTIKFADVPKTGRSRYTGA